MTKVSLPVRTLGLIVASGIAGIAIGGALARDAHPPVDVLLSSGTSVIGQPISYPGGTPQITAAVVTMMPGAQTGWHTHDVPLVAYVLEGQVTVDYGPAGTRTYRPGDAFIEAYKTKHNGANTTDGVTRIFAVFAGSDSAASTVASSDD